MGEASEQLRFELSLTWIGDRYIGSGWKHWLTAEGSQAVALSKMFTGSD